MLLFLFFLELGYLPSGTLIMYHPPADIRFGGNYYTELEATVELYGFYAGGGVKTFVWTHGKTFWPHSANYSFRVGFRWSLFDVGFRHICVHPVVPGLGAWRPTAIWEASADTIFIRISNER